MDRFFCFCPKMLAEGCTRRIETQSCSVRVFFSFPAAVLADNERQTVAALTVRIDALHGLVNSTARMDFSCKRGYVKLLARRRKMLAYLKRKDFEIYRRVALETGLR